ncbi:hypothetical protein D3C85_1730060 [compost metagenome]
MLGLIERRIRFLDQLGGREAGIRHQGGHPEAATDPAGDQGFLVRDAQGTQGPAHLLGDLDGPL